MNAQDDERIKVLLKQALPRVDLDAVPARDLWPSTLRRLDAHAAALPWFDWALLAGLIALVAAFPAAIPVVLYYL
jgi:hypothetical protein